MGYENIGFEAFWMDNDHHNSSIFDFHCQIQLKSEHAWLSTYSEFEFLWPDSTRIETRIYQKVHKIIGPPPRGPQRAPVGPQKAPQDLLRRHILYIESPDQPQSGRYSYT